MRSIVIHRPFEQMIGGVVVAGLGLVFGLTTLIDGWFGFEDFGFLYVSVLPLLLLGISIIMHTRKATVRALYQLRRAKMSLDEAKELLICHGYDPLSVNRHAPFVEKLLANEDRFRYGTYFTYPLTDREVRLVGLRNMMVLFTVLITLTFLGLLLAGVWLRIGLISEASLEVFNVIVFFLLTLSIGWHEYKMGIFYRDNKERYLALIPHAVIVLFFALALPILFALIH